MDTQDVLLRHILNLEQSLLQPEIRESAQRVGELLADGFIEYGSSGKIYRYQKGDIFCTPAEGEIHDFSLRQLSDGCVLATYRFIRNGGAASLRSSVWKRFGNDWKIVFHQGTPEKTQND